MSEVSSERIAQQKGRQEWWKRLLKIVIPLVIILAIILIVFFDVRALAISFVFIIAAVLFVVFAAGGGKKQHATRNRSHYQGRFGGAGGIGQPSNLGRPRGRPTDGDRSQGSSSPYTSVEGYEAMVEAYRHHPPTQSSSQNQNAPKQSQLGSKISNTGIVLLLLAAAVIVWLLI